MHGGGAGNGGAGNGGAGNGGGRLPSCDICQKLLDEMRFGRKEQKGVREDLTRRLSQLVTRLEDRELPKAIGPNSATRIGFVFY